MKRRAVGFESSLPGYDSLRPAHILQKASIHLGIAARHMALQEHRAYLDNAVYDQYLQVPKSLVGEQEARTLIELGDQLSLETLPTYQNAAGWAYAEAALSLASEPAKYRMSLLDAAEEQWELSLQTSHSLDQSDIRLCDRADMLHTALHLAYVPVMKALVAGNVTDATRERVFASTLAIAQSAAIQLELAAQSGDVDVVGECVGFIHECNAHLTLLYLDDARYIPLPASERADSGYYNNDQTHDIMILNQHWGEIRKVIPAEIKAVASARDRKRYKALLVRGKMHLIVGNSNNPTETLDAYARAYDGEASLGDQKIIDHAAVNMLHLLRLYQQGQGDSGSDFSTKTVFHDPRHVFHLYKGQ